MNFETLPILIAAFALVVSIISLLYLRKQIILLKKEIHDQHDWNRRDTSIKYSGLYHPKVKESRIALDEHFDIFTRPDSISYEEIKRELDKNKKLRSDLNFLLTYYENIAISCLHNVADEKIIRDMMRGSYISFKNKIYNYIMRRRKITGNDKLWENFISLANKWENEENDKTGHNKLGI